MAGKTPLYLASSIICRASKHHGEIMPMLTAKPLAASGGPFSVDYAACLSGGMGKHWEKISN
jgi:hypothetical protein